MTRIIPPLVSEMVEGASNDAGSDVFPFWKSDNDAIREEGMYLLALELDVENFDELFSQLPTGYRIVHSIFNWEQSRAGEGFKTGTQNSGEALVHAAAAGYDAVGMPEEALALRRMLDQYAKEPLDHDRMEAEYNAAAHPYKDDWERIPYLVRHLCENADAFFHVAA